MITEFGAIMLAILFIGIGSIHIIKPKAFLKIMPSYLPWQLLLVYLSGFFEILSGALLIYEPSSSYGALLIIFLLISFFPVHIHMLINKKASLGINKVLLAIRLLMQFFLIYWATLYL